MSESIKIISRLQQGQKGPKHYSLYQGLLLRKGRLVVIPSSSFQAKILQFIHHNPQTGHVGYHKTLQKAKMNFYWEGRHKDIKKLVWECEVCQINKHETVQYPGLLQPLSFPDSPWLDISMDFVKDLPLSNGYYVVFTVIDRLTKFAHFFPLSHPNTTSKVAHVFFSAVFKLHELPKSIVSNRDPIFTSSFWKQLFHFQGTSLDFSSAYHPQFDG